MSKNRNYIHYQQIPVTVIDHRPTRRCYEAETFLLTEQINLFPNQLVELFYTVKKFFSKKRKVYVTFIFENGSWAFHIATRTPADFDIAKMLDVIEDVLLVYREIQNHWQNAPDVVEFSEQIKPYIQLFYGKKLDSIPDWLLKKPLGQAIQQLCPKLREMHKYKLTLVDVD